MKALITGMDGFVGTYLCRELAAHGYTVMGISRDVAHETCRKVDLLDPVQTEAAVREIRPDVVFHLAGQADVRRSWLDPAGTMEANAVGTLRLLDAVRALGSGIRVLTVGSSDEYGSLGSAGSCVSETAELKPVSPYAISKVAQEQLSRAYAQGYGMDIRMTRSFNHCGAGQRRGFIVSDFASGIARIECGKSSALSVGNLKSARDYTHVRDVVRAYRLLMEHGAAGEVYNVGSGVSHTGKELLARMVSMAECPIPTVQDPDRLRPSDTPVIRCDNRKLREATGWQPTVSFDEMLADALQDWRRRERNEGSV